MDAFLFKSRRHSRFFRFFLETKRASSRRHRLSFRGEREKRRRQTSAISSFRVLMHSPTANDCPGLISTISRTRSPAQKISKRPEGTGTSMADVHHFSCTTDFGVGEHNCQSANYTNVFMKWNSRTSDDCKDASLGFYIPDGMRHGIWYLAWFQIIVVGMIWNH
ncbi:hypothetical protein NPIL_578321 [Nephila pilipes]|uniref:Uncharacterized protein n=1 Tax=Nephila pilipes TaxID=299642 RepID=A0A8X6P8G5_NEPPI|nr:hypothetical protein NPIL_578321 [Nephila pilipes]